MPEPPLKARPDTCAETENEMNAKKEGLFTLNPLSLLVHFFSLQFCLQKDLRIVVICGFYVS